MKDYEYLALGILAQAYKDAHHFSVRLDPIKSKQQVYKDINLIENALDACEWLESEDCQVYCDALGYCYEKAVRFAEKEKARWILLMRRAHILLGNRTTSSGSRSF